MPNLMFQSPEQWLHREAEAKFWTPRELLEECQGQRMATGLERMDLRGASFTAHSQERPAGLINPARPSGWPRPRSPADLRIVTPDGGTATGITHYAFDQISTIVGAPGGYLRKVGAELAAKCLNRNMVGVGRLFRHQGLYRYSPAEGVGVVRAFLGERYRVVWNAEVATRIMDSTDAGFRAPPAMVTWGDAGSRESTTRDQRNTEARMGFGGPEGSRILPSGLYMSDRDMVACMLFPASQFSFRSRSFARGYMVRNSEVGATNGALRFSRILYDTNLHVILPWGGLERLRHAGTIGERWPDAFAEVEGLRPGGWMLEDQGADLAKLTLLASAVEPASQIGMIEKYTSRLKLMRQSEVSLAMSHSLAYGNDSWESVLGFACGLSAFALQLQHADERARIYAIVGRIIDHAVRDA